MSKYSGRHLRVIVVLFSVGIFIVNGCAGGKDRRATGATTFAGYPDLTIPTLLCPATAKAGQLITNTYIVQNIAVDGCGPTRTHFWLSSSSTSTNGANKIKDHDIPGIVALGSYGSSPRMTLTAGVTGNKYIIAVADGPRTLVEGNETNNMKSCPITINP